MVLAGMACLAACNVDIDNADAENGSGATADNGRAGAPPLHFAVVDPSEVSGAADDQQQAISDIFRAQVLLDRANFSPGIIDGQASPGFTLALTGFQQANGLPQSGELDAVTRRALDQWSDVPSTVRVRIPDAFARQRFQPDLPEGAEKQAKLDRLGYKDLMEALGERFHTTPDQLVALNGPRTRIGPGAVIRVPNVPNAAPASGDDSGWQQTLQMLGVAPDQPAAARVVVDKSDGALRAFAEDGTLLAVFPATMGSEHDPLPIGDWTVLGVAKNPPFEYNPELFWDVSDDKEAQRLPPGPNGPVGVVWIDLSKEHYGIHGTSAPETIGTAQSHGCVRLTNWNAARLAQMVKPQTPVTFQE